MNLRKLLGAGVVAGVTLGVPAAVQAQTDDYVGAEVQVKGEELTRAPQPVNGNVRGAQESDDSGLLPVTGGDLVGMALFGAGAVAFGSVLLRRGRTSSATA
jgi:hypothetical protein